MEFNNLEYLANTIVNLTNEETDENDSLKSSTEITKPTDIQTVSIYQNNYNRSLQSQLYPNYNNRYHSINSSFIEELEDMQTPQ
ncbi:hypothetical protein CYY_005023 [Polysphondylium violaceum]|uniref:Uncharacterized protein n=1 Tax=Polysphondylium violaceum TaxID=133409 RepID=A0A8J4PTN5_9MYCE|nr:hypothetical protein CYY_005023 [Polysphondylium violaceum]